MHPVARCVQPASVDTFRIRPAQRPAMRARQAIIVQPSKRPSVQQTHTTRCHWHPPSCNASGVRRAPRRSAFPGGQAWRHAGASEATLSSTISQLPWTTPLASESVSTNVARALSEQTALSVRSRSVASRSSEAIFVRRTHRSTCAAAPMPGPALGVWAATTTIRPVRRLCTESSVSSVRMRVTFTGRATNTLQRAACRAMR
mmetsp:Transcript_75163/g.207366  ORF Transcript_75163/g.207366 Transcript_75163/m.207366 type:complete len:202 (-) Transcript_75163:2574-3179(-)